MIADHWAASQDYAQAAELAQRAGNDGEAQALYLEAAREAWRTLDIMVVDRQRESNPRAYGIVAVAVVALYAKAGMSQEAERARQSLRLDDWLQPWALEQLRREAGEDHAWA